MQKNNMDKGQRADTLLSDAYQPFAVSQILFDFWMTLIFCVFGSVLKLDRPIFIIISFIIVSEN